MKRKNGSGTRHNGIQAAAQAAIDDLIARNRVLPVTPLDDLP